MSATEPHPPSSRRPMPPLPRGEIAKFDASNPGKISAENKRTSYGTPLTIVVMLLLAMIGSFIAFHQAVHEPLVAESDRLRAAQQMLEERRTALETANTAIVT